MAVKPVLQSESTLTDRYQTTVPDPVRKALGLNKGDKIHYSIQSDGRVVISRVNRTERDPVIEKFLNFLAEDLEQNPQHVRAISAGVVSRARSSVAEVDLDLDSPLLEEDE